MSNKTTSSRRSGWRRPPGPVNVWRIVEGAKSLDNSTQPPVRFSIQEVPEERRDEALQHMIKYFIPYEPMSKCHDGKNDPKYIHDYSLYWKYCLEKQGIVLAAYVVDSNGQISDLAAINMVYVVSDETQEEVMLIMKKLQSPNTLWVFETMTEMTERVNPCKIFGVDKYLAACGLCVAPSFRGHNLGLRLLEARKDVGIKYGIPVTSTCFSNIAAQISAERAGFKLEYEQKFADYLTEEGAPLFPNIESKEMKVMMKRLY